MKSKGGVSLTQDKHNNDTMPGYCQGCAWAVLGECTVFNSPWQAWVNGEGQCEAYATEEEREAIEHKIDRYIRF